MCSEWHNVQSNSEISGRCELPLIGLELTVICRCEYVVESGERYVGEWEDGKPKWVQSLGDGLEDTSKLSEDMKAKVDAALEVCYQPGPFCG
jgi:hypothetical protein